MSLWWPWWTHSYWFLPLTLAQSHRFFSTLAGICLFWIKKTKQTKRKTNNKKKKNSAPTVLLTPLSFISLSRSLTLTRANTNPTHWSQKVTTADKISISQKLKKIKKGERKKRQHPPSNTVYAEWSCVLGWQSIYTWEEGKWYWDLSNIAANEALPPGKLGKSWWTAEEISMKAFPKDVKQKQR